MHFFWQAQQQIAVAYWKLLDQGLRCWLRSAERLVLHVVHIRGGGVRGADSAKMRQHGYVCAGD
jgi:hypothetical protein